MVDHVSTQKKTAAMRDAMLERAKKALSVSFSVSSEMLTQWGW